MNYENPDFSKSEQSSLKSYPLWVTLHTTKKGWLKCTGEVFLAETGLITQKKTSETLLNFPMFPVSCSFVHASFFAK